MADVFDDKANSTLGYSFLQYYANHGWMQQAQLHLFRKLDKDTRYDATRRKFLEKLALAIHLTAGQPSRRTEQRPLRWQNSQQGGLRNIMVCNGHVCVRCIWTKRRWTSSQEYPVWRVLPPLLGKVVVAYLSTVLPFAKCIHRARGQRGNLSYHLYSLDVLSIKPSDGKSIEAVLEIEQDDEEDDGEPSNGGKNASDVTDAQASHSSSVARMIYAVEYDTGERFNKFFQASLQWHKLFRVDGSSRGTKRSRDDGDEAAASENPSLDQQSLRINDLLRLATHETLQAMYHRSDIQMRDHQHDLFKAMDDVDKVVYVVGTGGGKSIAFALPAYVQPEGCNIVIQPTRALQQDTFARLTAMKINVSIWEPHSTNPTSSVILVTPEAMARREWKGFAQR
ncbi:hypothetical protein F4801DRAFT_585035 [Xylaria longipes]|nr:hypothetical protein F4801DRAFT_585035 [Xylaria longipes]